jgi:hypothetical protein
MHAWYEQLAALLDMDRWQASFNIYIVVVAGEAGMHARTRPCKQS